MPRTESAVFPALPFTSSDFCDFRTHRPRMRIDDLSALSGSFVARVSASVTAVDRCPGRGRVLLAAGNDFASVSAVPPSSARAPQNPRLPRRPSPSRLHFQGVLHRGPTPSIPLARPCPHLSRLALRRLHSDARRHSNSSWQCTPCSQLWRWARRGPLNHRPGVLTPRRESHGRDRPRPPLRPLLLPPHRSPRYQSRPITAVKSLWELLSYGFRLLLEAHRLQLQS